MNKRNLWLGIFVVVAIALFGAGLFLIGNEHEAFRHHTDFYTEFANIDGIAKGAKVRVDGMDAGEVQDVSIPPSPSGKFRLQMKLDDRLHGLIRDDSVVSVETTGLVGDKYLLVGGGNASSPQAPSGATLPSKEPFAMSKMLAKADGLLTQVSGTITQVSGTIRQVDGTVANLQGKLDGTLNAATSTLRNANGMVTDVRHGKGAAGVLLADPATAENVKQAVADARKTTANLNTASAQVNSMVGEVQQRQLVAKVERTLNNTESATQQLDQASHRVNETLESAFAPDEYGEDAGSNVQQSLTNLNESTGNLADDTEALKHEFFFRGFFKKRGYNSLDRLPVNSYRDGTLLKRQPEDRQWIPAAELFEPSTKNGAPAAAGSPERLSAAGRAALDEAASRIPNLYTSALIVEGYASAGSTGQELSRSRQRAILVRNYLQLHFDLGAKDVGVIGLSATPPVAAGRPTWDGVCVVKIPPGK